MDPTPRAQIRFAAEVLRRLGEELNPSIDQGIIELVKNAYDADATGCTIELVGVEQPGGTVRVVDDGTGMTSEQIKDGWLVLGRSTKVTSVRTKRDRLPAGNKGLGRLAALRLGHTARLTTRAEAKPGEENTLVLDWDRFDEVELIDQVDLEISSHPTDETHGTEIAIEKLRGRIGRSDAKRLARGLLLLADPFGDDPEAFRPQLISTEYEDLSKLVAGSYFTEAEYHLVAEVDSEGNATAQVLDAFDGPLYVAEPSELNREKRPYQCPAARLDLWVFILSAEDFRMRAVSLQEVREWLRSFGGVHLYLNGLRVAPYGDPGDDWLGLNLARVRSPENRPGTNTAIGRVTVQDEKELLKQKTDRHGIIDSEAFQELHRFAVDAAEFMARRRQAASDKRRREEKEAAEAASKSRRTTVVEEIRKSGSSNIQQLEKAFNEYERANEKERDTLRSEIQLYRTLATAGITAATFAHESAGSPLKVIDQCAKAIRRRGATTFGQGFLDLLQEQLDALDRALRSLGVLGSVTLRLIEARKRRSRRVDVHLVVNQLLGTLAPFLEQRRVSVEVDLYPGSPHVHGTEAALESVLTNLVNNSLVALEESATNSRRIKIQSSADGQSFTLRVSDNGPGIEDLPMKDIWLAGQTSKENGTGLGLTIVRDAVADLGGKVSAEAHGELGGAAFSIELPLLEV
ncbi:GHKL domain-containing protein [Lentzea sp. NEAU-D13]|uniref:histidine kinase n=1 Tax=Lentzea alba TaxID=2714351 RepID=A0A7C9RSA4_9PSEU|nr:ATP-binding protein [Lentzea alba]NGY61624.1 GHKL domain-containing protein [Lentzea alba]